MQNEPQTTYKAWIGLFSFGLTLLAGLFISQAMGLFAAKLIGLDISELSQQGWGSLTETPGNEIPLLLLQLIYALVLFIIAPLFFLSFINKSVQLQWVGSTENIGNLAIMAVLIVIAYFPSSAYLVNWNAGLQLPEAFAQLEQSLKAQEQALQELTAYFINFHSFGHFAFGILVIAVVPGIGEELVFRGLIQRYLTQIFKNPHAGIWVTGLLFSLFHWQFYGLFPRWILGALFGYLYWWSGRLIIPIIAHFINNAFTLILAYMWQQQDSSGLEGLEDVSGQVSIWVAITSTAIVLAFLRYFKQAASKPVNSAH